MTVIEAFAKNVRAELKDRGWSQKELSKRTGIHVYTINGLLNGHHGPSLYTANLIARAFEEPLDYLTKGADE